MTAKQIAVKRYVVRLSGEEREQLNTMPRAGKHPAWRWTSARILLKADAADGGDGWSDSQIAAADENQIAGEVPVVAELARAFERCVEAIVGSEQREGRNRSEELRVRGGSK